MKSSTNDANCGFQWMFQYTVESSMNMALKKAVANGSSKWNRPHG